MQAIRLSGSFLVATPILQDGVFDKSLILLCEHNDQGALGLVVNKPLSLSLADLMQQAGIPPGDSAMKHAPVFFGGPVQVERGFVLHETGTLWKSTILVEHGLAVTVSRDILEAMSRSEGPKQSLVALGYSGWGPGQLESEISRSAWLVLPADKALIFDTPPEERLSAALAKVGVSWDLLSQGEGHA